ncbi:MAG: hypothetical protein QM820_59920 [Minicystis sp.]
MAASLPSRTIASVAALGVLMASTSVSAQSPAPAAPSAGYAPYAPGGYAPPGYPYAPYGAPYAPYAAPAWAPQAPAVELKRRSPAMLGTGITLLVLGGTGMIIGSSMFAGGSKEIYVDIPPCFEPPCPDFPETTSRSGLKYGGIAVMVISAVSLVAGVPLTVIGSRMVPAKPEAAAFLPELTGSGLRWHFQ